MKYVYTPSHVMRRAGSGKSIQFGCGKNKLSGWENFDTDVDMRKPLPFPNAYANFVFAEHALEHLSQQDAWNFLMECHRILMPRGVIRLIVPSIVRISQSDNADCLRMIKQRGWGDGTLKSAIKSLIFLHDHKSMWTEDLLITVLNAIGFKAYRSQLYTSQHKVLDNIDGHWKEIGRKSNEAQSVAVEGIKP